MARLFGIGAGQIEQIYVYPGGTEETLEQLGPAFDKGVIAILTKDSTPKSGDIIKGVVKDADGPVPNARISERNHNAKELSYTFSDEKGQFSIKYTGNATYLVVECAGYHIYIQEELLQVQITLLT